jgi:hypothetical protein
VVADLVIERDVDSNDPERTRRDRLTRELQGHLHGIREPDDRATATSLYCSPARLIAGCVGAELITVNGPRLTVVAADENVRFAACLREEMVAPAQAVRALCRSRPSDDCGGGPETSAWIAYEMRLSSDGLRLDSSLPIYQHGDFAVRLLVYASASGATAASAVAALERRQLVVDLVSNRILARAYREVITNLDAALESNRRIGVAIGVLMTRYRVTDAVAFDLLRQGSQRGHVKLRDVAEYVLLTGGLD